MVAGLWLELTSRQPLADALGIVVGVVVVRRGGHGGSCSVKRGQRREQDGAQEASKALMADCFRSAHRSSSQGFPRATSSST